MKKTSINKLVEYGVRVAKINHLDHTIRDIKNIVKEVLKNDNLIKNFQTYNKDTYKEVIYNYICFGDIPTSENA